MKKSVFLLIWLFIPSPLRAFEVTPTVLEVSNELQPDPALTFELTTDLPDGVAWEAASNQPFVSFASNTGVSPTPLRVEIDQVELGTFLAESNSYQAATIRITANSQEVEIPVNLKEFAINVQRILWTKSPGEFLILNGPSNNGAPVGLVKFQASTGLIIDSFDIPEFYWNVSQDPQGAKAYFTRSTGDLSTVRVLDLQNFNEDDPITVPGGAVLRAVGRDFLLFEGTNTTVINGQGVRGQYFTFDPETQTPLAILGRTLDGATAAPQRKSEGGDLLMLKGVFNRPNELDIFRVERGEVIQEFDSLSLPPIIGPSPSPILPAFVSPDGKRIFLRNRVIERETGEVRNLPRLRQAYDSSRDGRLMVSQDGLGFTDVDEVIAQVAEGSFPGPHAFSADDQFLFVTNGIRAGKFKFLKPSPFLSPPEPLDNSRLSSLSPQFSIPALEQAQGYELVLTRLIDGEVTTVSSTSNEITLPNPLWRGYQYEWRIDTMTPAGLVTGTTQRLETIFTASQAVPTQAYATTDRSLVAFYDLMGEVAEIRGLNEEGIEERVQVVTLEQSTGTGRGREAVLVGGKLFVNSGEGIFEYAQNNEGRWSFRGKIPLPPGSAGENFGYHLAEAGDLLFVTSVGSVSGIPRVEIFRTQPEVTHQATLPLPLRPGANIPRPWELELAASGETVSVVLGADPNLNEEPVTLFIFDRPDDSLAWEFNERHEFPSSRRSRPPLIAMDGNHIAMVLPNPDQEELLVLKRQLSGKWQEQDLPREEFPRWSTQDPLTLQNGILLIDSPAGLQLLRENQDDWTVQSSFGQSVGRHVVAKDKLLLQTNDPPGRYSVFREVFPTDGVPCLEGVIVSEVVAGGQYEISLKQQSTEEVATLLAGPSWLNLRATEDGQYLLEGSAPASPERSTVIVKAEGESGLRDFRVFDLNVVANDVPLQVALEEDFDRELIAGESISLQAEASGSGNLTYQWFKDGVALEGQNARRFSLTGTDSSDSGAYFVRVSNSLQSVETTPESITVTRGSVLGTGWTTIDGGPEQRNFSPASLGDSEPILMWSRSQATSTPVILDGQVYFSAEPDSGPRDYFLVATSLNLIDGSPNWQVTPKAGFLLGQPAVSAGRVFFCATTEGNPRDTVALALDARSGNLLWEQSPEFPPSIPLNQDGRFTPITGGNRLWSGPGLLGVQSWTLDGEDRLKYQTSALGSPVGIALSSGHLFGTTFPSLLAFDSQTAEVRSETSLGTGSNTSSVLGGTLATDGQLGTLVFGGQIQAFDLESLERLWSASPEEFDGEPGRYLNYALTGKVIIAVNVAESTTSSPDSGASFFPALIEVLDRQSGRKLGTLPTQIPGSPGPFSPVNFDIIGLNDSFVVSIENSTTIFDLETLEERHQLPHGGNLIYGDGFLVIREGTPLGVPRGLHAYQMNDRPEIIAPSLTEALEDQEYLFDLTADHFEDNETLTYELVGQPDWITVTAEGQVTIAPLQEDIGDDLEKQTQYTIRVSDGVTTPVEQTFPITLIAVNDDPIISLGDLITDEDSDPITRDLFEFVSDEESPVEDLAIQLTGDQSGTVASVTLEDSTLTILPLPDQFGTFTFALIVSDPDGGETRREIAVTINPVNDPPDSALAELINNANPDGRNQTLDLSDILTDRDPGDRLAFTFAGNTRLELFQTVALNRETGLLVISYAPYVSGQAIVTVVATDLEGESVQLPVIITLPEPAPPTITTGSPPDVESEISLNPQTGLFEQKLTITNNAARAIGGFLLEVDGLTNGFRLYQDEPGQVVYGSPLEVDQSVSLTLEYYSPSSGEPPTPTLTVTPILPRPQESADTLGQTIEQVRILDDLSILLEFESELDAQYVVQYSFDMSTWYNSPVIVSGKRGRTQWLDQGLPRTPCHPRDCPSRFYRVLRVL